MSENNRGSAVAQRPGDHMKSQIRGGNFKSNRTTQKNPNSRGQQRNYPQTPMGYHTNTSFDPTTQAFHSQLVQPQFQPHQGQYSAHGTYMAAHTAAAHFVPHTNHQPAPRNTPPTQQHQQVNINGINETNGDGEKIVPPSIGNGYQQIRATYETNQYAQPVTQQQHTTSAMELNGAAQAYNSTQAHPQMFYPQYDAQQVQSYQPGYYGVQPIDPQMLQYAQYAPVFYPGGYIQPHQLPLQMGYHYDPSSQNMVQVQPTEYGPAQIVPQDAAASTIDQQQEPVDYMTEEPQQPSAAEDAPVVQVKQTTRAEPTGTCGHLDQVEQESSEKVANVTFGLVEGLPTTTEQLTPLEVTTQDTADEGQIESMDERNEEEGNEMIDIEVVIPVVTPKVTLKDPAQWEMDPMLKDYVFELGDSDEEESAKQLLIKELDALLLFGDEKVEVDDKIVKLPVDIEYIYEKACPRNEQLPTKEVKRNDAQPDKRNDSEKKPEKDEKIPKVVEVVQPLPQKKEIELPKQKVIESKPEPKPLPQKIQTVPPVVIVKKEPDHIEKPKPALPQADPRGPNAGPRPAPEKIETAPKPSCSWAKIASKGTRQVHPKTLDNSKSAADITNLQKQPKKPVPENVDPMAVQITSILNSPNSAIDSSGIPRGLINQANSCWVNSILQTALVCDPLYHLLFKLLKYTSTANEHQNTKEIAKIGAEIKRLLPTCSKLAEVFDEIVNNKGGLAYEAKEVYSHISNLNPDISVGQQDAEEGLSLLLNAMHDEIVALKKAAGITTKEPPSVEAIGEGWQVSGRTKVAFLASTSVTGSAFDESPISVGFRGISQSSLKLPSPHQSPQPTEEPFFTLKVDVPPPPVPGSDKAISIEDCLRLTPKEEILDEYKLKSGQSVPASRKVSLASLPPVLILHMKRIQFNQRTFEVKKIDRKVTVKERISIEPSLQSPALKDRMRGGIDYELRGMVLHHGISAEGGHYTAECRRGQKWYRIDDNRVSEIKLSEVLHADSRRTPYLLFYKKVAL